MPIRQHVLTNIDAAALSADCSICGRVRAYNRISKLTGVMSWYCGRKPAERATDWRWKNGTKLQHILSDINEVRRTGTCAKCGFVRILEAKGARKRRDSKWACSTRPPDRVGGKTLHTISNVNEELKTGVCAKCGPVQLIWRPYTNGSGRWGCIVTRFTISAAATQYAADYRGAICPICGLQHRWDRRRGRACRNLIVQQQEGKCAICKTATSNSSLHMDHDHKTGAFRGALCMKCNAGLGYLRDSPEILQAAIDYLDAAEERSRDLQLAAPPAYSEAPVA